MNCRSTPLKILSLNCYILGHVTYQNILEQTFRDHFPEVEFYSLHLTDYFKTDFLGRVVHLLLRQKLPGAAKADYDFHRFRTELANSFFALRCLERAIDRYQPDLLHIHTQGIALLAAPLMRQIPTIISIDCTTAPLAVRHPAPARLTYQPILAAEKRCFQAATHVVSCSEWAKNSVVQDYGISPSKVTVIPYGMPLTQFAQLERNQKPSGKTRLLFIGNDFVRKGGEDLLAVFAEKLVDRCELDIVTNAPLTSDIPGICIHRNVRPMSPELLQLYQNADIFVMPTREDVYGVVYIEAMAAGLPCIGTTGMAIPELVRDGVNGITVPAGDRSRLYQAIDQLVTDPELRQALGSAGRRLAQEQFNSVTNCGQLLDLFRACAASLTGEGLPVSLLSHAGQDQ